MPRGNAVFRSLFLRRLLFGGAVLATIFASLNKTSPPPSVAESDKLGHFAAYAVNGVLASAAFPGTVALRAAFASLFVMGGGLEVIQGTLPHRNASWGDMGANTAGLLAGGALALLGRRARDD